MQWGTSSCDIRTKFVRILYEFRTNSYEIHRREFVLILRESMCELRQTRNGFDRTTLNMWKQAFSQNLKGGQIYRTTILAKTARARNTHHGTKLNAKNSKKNCQIRTTVNLPFKRPLHEGYANVPLCYMDLYSSCPQCQWVTTHGIP